MQIQHIFDSKGCETAVIIPIETWREILRRLDEPNAETIAAMQEGRNPAMLKSYTTPEDLWAELDADQ